MTTTPTVSVIIPTYNRAGMLKEAIDSVLAQDYSDFELIVVDDGSTDETPHILKCYGGKIKRICQRNQGVSAARNRGIAAASGQPDPDSYGQAEGIADIKLEQRLDQAFN